MQQALRSVRRYQIPPLNQAWEEREARRADKELPVRGENATDLSGLTLREIDRGHDHHDRHGLQEDAHAHQLLRAVWAAALHHVPQAEEKDEGNCADGNRDEELKSGVHGTTPSAPDGSSKGPGRRPSSAACHSSAYSSSWSPTWMTRSREDAMISRFPAWFAGPTRPSFSMRSTRDAARL